MSTAPSFISKIKSRFVKKSTRPPRPFIYPLREWAICLLFSLVCAVGIIGHAAYDFHTQLHDTTVTEITEEQIPRYRPDEAEAILLYYEGKQKTFDTFTAIRSDPAPVEVPPRVEEGE